MALLVALATWFAPPRTGASRLAPSNSFLGLTLAIVWVLGPFLLPLAAFLKAPIQAITTLVTLGALGWLLNEAMLWIVATILATLLAGSWASVLPRRWLSAITLALLPISIVALAYLVDQWPILGNRWTLMALTALFVTGLLVGNTPVPLSQRQRWLRAAGCTLLVMTHTFPLQLVLQLPPAPWMPTLGIVCGRWAQRRNPQPHKALPCGSAA